MKELVTTSWRALVLLLALFAFSSANAQQPPCGITVNPSGEVLFESVGGALVYKVITVTNTTTQTVTVSVHKSGHDTAAFLFEPRSFMLQANGKKEFKVYFKPNSANVARYAAMLNFSTDPGTVCHEIEMIGTGAGSGGGDDKGLIGDPGSYKYPETVLNGQSCKTFYIKNLSSNAAVISVIRIDGDESFVITEVPTVPKTVEADGGFELEVCYTPDEQADMYVSGKIVLEYVLANTGETKKLLIALASGANSGGDQIVMIDPAQFQFPATAVGETTCKEFRVVNKSSMKALISTFAFEGNDQFTVTSLTPLPVELNKGDSLYLRVCYTPTALNQEAKGSLSVNYSFDGGTTTKHATAVFFAMSDKQECVVSSGGDAWKEPILIGGKSDRVLYVTNKTNSDITITEIKLAGEDAAAFTINATPPITIPAMSKVEIPFTFAPIAKNGYLQEKYLAAVVLTLQSADPASDCRVHEGHIWGYSLKHHDDKDSTHSVAISLFPDEKQTIGLANRGIKESYTLLFKNNLDKDVIVESISLMDGTKFKIAETVPATTPFTLKPQETFTVTITFESADGLLYKDKLIIVSNFAATTIEFDLQGINAEKARVGTMPEGVSVTIMPNPMRTNTTVNFEGVRSATIEVSDVLGSTIMSTSATADWKWNGRTATGAMAPAGTYFVRIQGESINGERFVTTQRVVVEH